VNFSSYREILHVRDVRLVLLLGLLIRTPMFAGAIILTLHVVSTLGHSYTAAGLLTTCSAVALAVGAPWRGRLLDLRGLRRTLLPQLVVLVVVWSVAPWVGYPLLLPLAFIGGLFAVPMFSVMRQALISATETRNRTAALSLDSLTTDLTFMVGPVLGVLTAAYVDTRWVLFGAQMLTVLGGILLWLFNPKLVGVNDQASENVSWRTWVSPIVLAILAASAASAVSFTGADLGLIAALNSMDHPGSIGWVLTIWALGSAVGALAYGAWHRSVPFFLLLALLAVFTVPVALATNRLWLAVLMFGAGFFGAPTITATIDHLSRVVPARAHGEAMGWHGSALTTGSALGAPIAGAAIDWWNWQAAFVVTSSVALVVALGGLVASAGRGRTPLHAASAVARPVPTESEPTRELS
jgi:MFS family permease